MGAPTQLAVTDMSVPIIESLLLVLNISGKPFAVALYSLNIVNFH